MKFVLFYHSLISDWNHGNAHFLRGVASELIARGHQVTAVEHPLNWSLTNLLKEHGEEPIREFRRVYPTLKPRFLGGAVADWPLDEVLAEADVVIVHEWNAPELISLIGQHRRRTGAGYALLFHDTHHRGVTAPEDMARFDLREYDGVLAFGEVLSELYREKGWAERAWTWHEAADTRVFFPRANGHEAEGDLVWIGNWGDDERTAELHEFLLRPTAELGLRATVHGVRYPREAKAALRDAGLSYRGWLPNLRVPEAFSRYRVTIHVPRRPYVEALPGIPTIRPFEAMACGIPLVCSPWQDSENLFRPGNDYLVARNGADMKTALRAILHEPELARTLASNGLETIRGRHTCAHRTDELLQIVESLVSPTLATSFHEKDSLAS
ncbi:MAG: glycosyltransferase [Sumerlaeia bacterium]